MVIKDCVSSLNNILSKNDILSKLETIQNTYCAWHIDHILVPTPDKTTSRHEDTNHYIHPDMNMNE